MTNEYDESDACAPKISDQSKEQRIEEKILPDNFVHICCTEWSCDGKQEQKISEIAPKLEQIIQIAMNFNIFIENKCLTLCSKA